MKDLIQRLRTVSGRTCIEAADALEKQQAEIERRIMEVDASRDRIEDLQEELATLKAQAAKDAADAIGVEQEVAELRLFKHNMTLRYDAMNVDLAAYRNSFTELKVQAAKDAADAELWRAYKTRKDAVIAVGMARNPMRQSAFDTLPDDFEVN